MNNENVTKRQKKTYKRKLLFPTNDAYIIQNSLPINKWTKQKKNLPIKYLKN